MILEGRVDIPRNSFLSHLSFSASSVNLIAEVNTMKLQNSYYFTCFVSLLFWASCAQGKNEDSLTFPDGFMIGVASSAHQVEGAWNISGKGESVWDRFTHSRPDKIADRSNADVTCDSYHKYKEDVQLLRWLGVDFYRFSISWARILPTGFANVINEDGIRYYNGLINELIKYNITPMVTLYHWDHPQVFQDMGGWTNEAMVDLFGDYVRVIFREFGDRVKIFSTVNEPDLVCQFTYSKGTMAPGIKLGKHAEYLCYHNLLKAHAYAYHIYDDEFRAEQKGKIGIVMHLMTYFPKYANDHTSADIAFQFQFGMYAHPIFSKHGDYPAIVKTRVAENSKLEGLPRSRLPSFSQGWIDYIKGTADYLGINHYTSSLAEPAPKWNRTIDDDDSGILASTDKRWPATAFEPFKIVPEGLSAALLKLKQEYNNPPVYITENGMSDLGLLDDKQRIEFHQLYMKSMLKAINTYKCDVRSYTIWSLMDSYEWASGYTQKFGLFKVNFTSPNRERTPKASAYWLKNIIHTRKLQQ